MTDTKKTDTADPLPTETGRERKPGTFPPGVSGNPAGRPPKRGDIRGQLRFLAKQDEIPEVTFSVGQRIAARMLRALDGLEGDALVDAAGKIITQGWGSPKQSLTVDGGLDLSMLTPEQVQERLAQIRAEREALEKGGM